MNRLRPAAIWLVLLSIASVQVGAALAKGLFGQVSPVTMTWLRVTAAAMVLGVAVRPWRSLPRRTDPAAQERCVLLAAFAASLMGMNLFIYLAFSHIPMGTAVTIEFLGPLAVAIAGSRRRADLVWGLLAASGVVVLGLVPGRLDVPGVLFALAAAACWAGYILFGARMAGRWREADAVALACMAGAVVFAPFVLFGDGVGMLTGHILMIGALVGLMSTVIPYTVELRALRHIPPATFGILMSLEPAAAAVASWLVIGEVLRPLDWVAMGCVIVASIGATRAARDRSAPAG